MLTYYAQYTQVSGGQESTVTIAHSPSRSTFSTSSSSVIIDEKATYYCSLHSDSTSISGTSGNTGSNSGNSGQLRVDLGRPRLEHRRSSGCLTQARVPTQRSGSGISSFRPSPLAALAEAKEGLVSKRLGIEVSSSSASFAGQPSTCVTVSGHGKGGRYCVTKRGILSYSGSSSSDYFRLTKYSSKPPASLFTLPPGAASVTLPGGGSIP